MDELSSRQKGNAGLGDAIAWFSGEGYVVSIPLTDSQEYDLLVDIDNIIKKVQVKYTSYKNGKYYQVGLRTWGGNWTQKAKVKEFNFELLDILFVLCADGAHYCIPTKDISSKTYISLGPKWEYCILT